MTTLSQLRTFQTVARLNSFSRAAQELHLTQPAVSAQIGALESALRIRLFERNGKTITLTEPGRIALAGAQDIGERLAQMRRELDELGEVLAGRLQIGASMVAGVYFLPEVLARFKDLYPEAELSLKVEPGRQIIDQIQRNELDVALVGEVAGSTDSHVAFKPILQDELIVVAPPDNPLAEAGVIQLDALAELPFVLPESHSASGESIYDQLRAAGITLKSVIELGNTGAVKHAVMAGLGLSIISHMAVVRELEEGKLCSLRIADLALHRQFGLSWNHEKPFSRLTSAFIGFVQTYAKTWSESHAAP
jgi:DNA-binding transcriptional LysR family regulator